MIEVCSRSFTGRRDNLLYVLYRSAFDKRLGPPQEGHDHVVYKMLLPSGHLRATHSRLQINDDRKGLW